MDYTENGFRMQLPILFGYTYNEGMKDKDLSGLVGKVGVTDTELRPSGTVLIDNEIYDP